MRNADFLAARVSRAANRNFFLGRQERFEMRARGRCPAEEETLSAIIARGGGGTSERCPQWGNECVYRGILDREIEHGLAAGVLRLESATLRQRRADRDRKMDVGREIAVRGTLYSSRVLRGCGFMASLLASLVKYNACDSVYKNACHVFLSLVFGCNLL